jgi:hypothetical protein
MRIPDEMRTRLAMEFAVLFPHLDERQRRLLMAAEARVLGHGGVRAAVRAASVSETTVRKGVSELEAGEEPVGRVRRPGGGRKRVAVSIRGCGRPCWRWLSRTRPPRRGGPDDSRHRPRTAWVMSRPARHADESGYAMTHLNDERRAAD